VQVNLRSEPRNPCRKTYSISWQVEDGIARAAQAHGVDLSRSGVGIRVASPVRPGVTVYVQDPENHLSGYSVVRHCTPRGDGYFIGLELHEETRKTVTLPADDPGNHYEFLQISPKAEPATIQRVYRFLAGRFHPDNPETGDPEKFLLLNRAFAVLSDPERRAAYDSGLEGKHQAIPEFESVDFMDGVEGEVNRRLAVLSLLYRRCRASVENPKVTLAEMEEAMGFPREYLDFTTWYLRSKKYITREDNSDFALTVLGVDYVEENYSKLPILRKLLNAGAHQSGSPGSRAAGKDPDTAIFLPGPEESPGRSSSARPGQSPSESPDESTNETYGGAEL
jgi:curved DNA-binding protein